jgi:hypothetical protein
MRYVDRSIRSVGEMLQALKSQTKPKKLTWFRGHSRKDWRLVPSLARDARHLGAESALLKRFMQNAVPHLDIAPREEWEWMFLMQHHRAPTRLLDWSESALTALYFAVSDDKYKRAAGAVWCLDPIALNKEARIDFKFSPEVPAFGTDNTTLSSYLPSRVEANPSTLNPVAIMGPRNTTRMAAQLGTFTVNHRLHTPIEKIGVRLHCWRWLIPAAAKPNIRAELALLSYSALTLFPDLDRVADLSKELLP